MRPEGGAEGVQISATTCCGLPVYSSQFRMGRPVEGVQRGSRGGPNEARQGSGGVPEGVQMIVYHLRWLAGVLLPISDEPSGGGDGTEDDLRAREHLEGGKDGIQMTSEGGPEGVQRGSK
eukprot:523562-Prorocentrum_minimum.AAC.1